MAWRRHPRPPLCTQRSAREPVNVMFDCTARHASQLDQSSGGEFFTGFPCVEELSTISAVGCILAEFIKCFNSPFINRSIIGPFNRRLYLQQMIQWMSFMKLFTCLGPPAEDEWTCRFRGGLISWLFIAPRTQTNTLKWIVVGLFWMV